MNSFVVFLLLVNFQVYVSSSNCFWNNECKYKYFSSKTPYENVRGDIRDAILKQKDCEPVSIWTYIRHGKRNPGRDFAKKMSNVITYKNAIVSNHENGNSSLCAQDVENIKKWTINEAILSKPQELATEGYLELVYIAKRLKEAVPELLNDLKNGDYVFHPTFGDRMVDSGKGFIEGLGNKNLTLENVIFGYDDMAPYMTCKDYQIGVRLNPNTYIEVDKYLESAEYLEAKRNIEMRLGLHTLDNDEIIALYDVCRYSWDGIANKPDPWCAVFSKKDLEILEYFGDLRHYYRNGYGTSYSSVFSQIALSNVLRAFEDAKKGRGKKITANFGHATMLDMLLVALNLARDENPLTGSYRDVNRIWRSTKQTPFAANLITVLYRCENLGKTDHNIAFYWNEKPLSDMCQNGVCTWQEFENKFRPFLNANADFCEILKEIM